MRSSLHGQTVSSAKIHRCGSCALSVSLLVNTQPINLVVTVRMPFSLPAMNTSYFVNDLLRMSM